MSELKEKAQQLLAGRLDALDGIETAASRLARARADLKAAESAVSDAWAAATDAGWTPVELRRLGIAQPATRRGGRPKGRRAGAAQGNSGSGGGE